MPAMSIEFAGFQPSLIAFLEELETHNNRTWFAANKPRYETDVLAPALAFIDAMAPHMLAVSPHFPTLAKRVGGSLMRVYRDTRFARDKRPYKTNVGIQFRHVAGKDVHAPGFYVHIAPDAIFLGAGMWRPDREALHGIRERIAAHGDEWCTARNAGVTGAGFALGGEQLQRPPRGYDPEHRCIEDLKRKDFIAIRHLDRNAVLDTGFAGIAGESFAATAPFVEFLCRAVGVAF